MHLSVTVREEEGEGEIIDVVCPVQSLEYEDVRRGSSGSGISSNASTVGGRIDHDRQLGETFTRRTTQLGAILYEGARGAPRWVARFMRGCQELTTVAMGRRYHMY